MQRAGYKSAPIKWDTKIQEGVQTNIAISRRLPRLSRKFPFSRDRIYVRQKFSFAKNFAGHVRSRRRVKPSVNQYYGICMLFTREPPSTFVWIIPEINQCPFYHASLSDSSSLEQATRKADKWSQFVHFMRSYIIRETSRSHLRDLRSILSSRI